jgi:alpha-glucosidase
VLAPRPDLRAELVRRKLHVGVIGERQRAVDLPEYGDLPRLFPDVNWEAARAYSATEARPLLTAPEENLVCSAVNTYPDQQVLVHELGHSILDLAVRHVDPAFAGRVEGAYGAAAATGRWVGFYGGTSVGEYWAEGVQAYFDASHASSGPDAYGSPVGSRAELAAYDPALFDLVREVFTDNPWRATCP